MKYFCLVTLFITMFLFSCKKTAGTSATLACDTIKIIYDPVFATKGFTAKQMDTIRLYLYQEGMLKSRIKIQAERFKINYNKTTKVSTYEFGIGGFNRQDSLILRTSDDLIFFFTDFHYISKNWSCELSDTIVVNGKTCYNFTIIPDLGIPIDSVESFIPDIRSY